MFCLLEHDIGDLKSMWVKFRWAMNRHRGEYESDILHFLPGQPVCFMGNS